MHRRLWVIIAASCLFAQQDATFRLDVQRVLVPVVVTDKKGHHVTGLHASDFRIFEDGVQQAIASFSSDAAASADDIGALSKPASGVPAPKPAGPRRTYVICIDKLHTSAAGAARIRDALEKLFDKEKPGDAQYVLVGIGGHLQVLQAATTNPLAIILNVRSPAFQNAMSGLDASALSAEVQNLRSRMSELCKRCACGRSTQQNCDSEIDSLKQNIDAEAERWAAPTNGLLDQFKSVVDELAKLPTGRTLVLLSDGFNLNPKYELYAAVAAYLPNRPQFRLDDSAAQTLPGLHDALQIAVDRNVIIDAIDSRGGATARIDGGGSMDASVSGGSGGGSSVLGTNRTGRPAPIQSAPSPQVNSTAPAESGEMELLARATGGAYFRGGGDVLKQLHGALADGREYYLLTYTPKNSARDGKFRSITVETGDKNLSLRAKPGYWAAQ
ncbi:MAG: VWA domain-containing protein [Bryobacteraceae bacterium]